MIIFIGLGCGCQDINEDDIVPPVEITFELLNTNMEPADTFDAGEDILFKLSIENLSNRDVVLYYIHTDDKNWLKLKKWSRLSDTTQEEGWVDIGSPIKQFVQTFYIHGYPIPSKSSLLFVISFAGNQQSTITPDGWRVDYKMNNQLDKGKYSAEINSFQAVFTDSSTTIEKSFRKEFHIK
jgi:hypothetical protein